MKFLVVFVIGLIIGLSGGYFVPPRGMDPAPYERQITELESQLLDRDDQISNLLSHVKDLETNISLLQNQTEEKDVQVAELKLQIMGLKLPETNITELTLYITQLEEQIDNLLNQTSIKDAQIEMLEANIALLQDQIVLKEDEISLLKSQIRNLENEVQRLNAEIVALKAQMEPLDFQLIAVSFSRTQYTCGLLRDWVSRANETIYVMVMLITADDLADALIAAQNRGVNVTVIIDDDWKYASGSDYERILDAGIDIRSDNSWRLMHHKVMVIDGYIVVTGSYNWSASAEDKNYENIIIIDSQTVSNIYLEEFSRIWQQTLPGL